MMKRVIKQYMVIVAFGLALAGCAATDFDREFNFNSLTTYAWDSAEVKVDNPAYKGELIDKHIRTAVNNEFQKRGIRYDEQNPDFLVSYKTYTEKKE